MKNLLIALAGCFALALHPVSAQSYEWVGTLSSTLGSQANCNTLDAAGNIVSAGHFGGTADLDPGPGIFSVTAGIAGDGTFIQSLDPNGNFVWGGAFSGNYNNVHTITADLSGNVYLGGTFWDSVDFDPGPATSYMYSDSGDGFMVKIDGTGNLVWAKKLNSKMQSGVYALKATASGELVASGFIWDTTDMDPGPGVVNLTSAGYYDIFLLKLDASGNFMWATQMGGLYQDKVEGVDVDAAGNIYIAGNFYDSIDVDPGPGVYNLFTNSPAPASNMTILVGKYSPSGNLIWAHQASSEDWAGQVATDIVVTNGNAVYISALFSDTLDADPGPGVYLLPCSGMEKAFLWALDTTGNFLWANPIAGYGASMLSVDCDALGAAYATGNFNGTVDFDPGAGTTSSTSIGSSDFFVVKYDASGNYIWDYSAGSTAYEYGYAVTVDDSGNVYQSAAFSGTIDFDISAGTAMGTPGTPGSYDGHVLKLSQSPCDMLTVDMDSVMNIDCALGHGYASAVAGGMAGPYTWLWSTGDTTSFIMPSTPGIYAVTVTADSCSESRDVVISGPTSITSFDLRVSAHTSGYRPGFSSLIFTDASNEGCVSTGGTLEMILDSNLVFSSAVPAPTSVSGYTLTWTVAPMVYGSAHFTPMVHVSVPSTVPLGTNICNIYNFTPAAGDILPLNNIYEFCDTATGAYDPNYKAVHPEGVCEEHFVKMNVPLEYTIHFQNTGTAEAINVYILDTLDSDLNINTVAIKANSHAMWAETLPGNVLRFNFDNIMLPDSGTDYPGSNGYVIFEIQHDAGLPTGTSVYNGSAIYFDFNAPVITNVTMITLVDSVPPCSPMVVNQADTPNTVSLWPNPATDVLHITSSSPVLRSELLSLAGQQLVVSANPVLDVKSLPAGMYLVRVFTQEGAHTLRVVIE